jgi:hypothetical protein
MKALTYTAIPRLVAAARLTLLSLFIAIASPVTAQPRSTAAIPTTEPLGAGFRVRIPGDVRRQTKSEQLGSSTIPVVSLISAVGNETYMVIYTTYPTALANLMENANPNTLLDFARDKMLKSVAGLRLSNEKNIALSGYPGREVVYGGPGAVILRAYWALPHFYEVVAMRENSTSDRNPQLSRTAYSFINSFEILTEASSNLAEKQYDPDTPPFLSLDDRLFVGGELFKRGFSTDEARIWFLGVMKKAVSYLSPAERDELKLLNNEAYSTLTLDEATKFDLIKRRYEQGIQPTKEDERVTNELSSKALESLKPQKLARYQFLMGKGIRAALAVKQ